MEELKEIEAKVLTFLEDEVFDEAVPLDRHTDLMDAGLDSFALLKLIYYLETTFGVYIPETEISETHIRTISNLSLFVHDLQSR
jgi:acyl carrier protein